MHFSLPIIWIFNQIFNQNIDCQKEIQERHSKGKTKQRIIYNHLYVKMQGVSIKKDKNTACKQKD